MTAIKPKLVVVMGVSGSGKSTLARELAQQLSVNFIEADDYHSQACKQQMAEGIPLTDAMRAPWIDKLASVLDDFYQQNQSCVLAFSGLRRQHRQVFRQIGFATQYIQLQVPRQVLALRLQTRSAHFFAPSLLDSQLRDFQAPQNEPDIRILDGTESISSLLAHCQTLVNEVETAYA